MPCQVIGISEEELQRAADALTSGRLVAFPTETVYGLGGNAFIPDAVDSIFTVKGRPPTDPLICHVDQIEKGLCLWDNSPAAEQAVECATFIGRALWPAPLTIVCAAHPSLPPRVTGGCGCVGLRVPRHSVALDLLSRVPFPVAAPSANLFGHVSPTTAQHVYDDLAERDPNLLIIDGGTATIGIESTVVRVSHSEAEGYLVEVVRRGKVSVDELKGAMMRNALFGSAVVSIRDTRSKATNASTVAMDGPGQLLTHYSPRIPASLLTSSSLISSGLCGSRIQRGPNAFFLANTAVIDFNGMLKSLRDYALAYTDLSESGDEQEATHRVFDALRWSEQVERATNVVFPFLSEWDPAASELLLAVEDRLFRAASGTVAHMIE